jgi:hypothetical protein
LSFLFETVEADADGRLGIKSRSGQAASTSSRERRKFTDIEATQERTMG